MAQAELQQVKSENEQLAAQLAAAQELILSLTAPAPSNPEVVEVLQEAPSEAAEVLPADKKAAVAKSVAAKKAAKAKAVERNVADKENGAINEVAGRTRRSARLTSR